MEGIESGNMEIEWLLETGLDRAWLAGHRWLAGSVAIQTGSCGNPNWFSVLVNWQVLLLLTRKLVSLRQSCVEQCVTSQSVAIRLLESLQIAYRVKLSQACVSAVYCKRTRIGCHCTKASCFGITSRRVTLDESRREE